MGGTGLAVAFYVAAGVTVIGALQAILAERIVHAAFWLMLSFAGVAGLYGVLAADFLAATQVLIYVGGILVLLTFGVLLTGQTAVPPGRGSRRALVLAGAVGFVLFAGLYATLHGTKWAVADHPAEATGMTADLGRDLLGRYLVPFEFASVLLLVALVGAAYIARRQR